MCQRIDASGSGVKDAVGPGVHTLLEVGCERRLMRGQPPERVAE